MADTMKTLNTRIKLKYDSYENWLTNNPVLLEGEVAVATVSTDHQESTGFQNLPNVVIKVGDGEHNYSALPFVSGLAADVYEWAKAASKPTYTASEITGLDEFIAGEIQDTDTRYTIVTEADAPYVLKLMATDPDKSDLTYDTLVASIDLSTLDTRLQTVEAAFEDGGAIDVKIQGHIGNLKTDTPISAGAGKVFDTISQAAGMISATTRDLTIADVAGLQDAIDDLDEAKQDVLDIDGTPSADNPVLTASSLEDIAYPDNNFAEGQFVIKVTQDSGMIEVTRRALRASDIPALEMDKITGLADEFAKKQDKLEIADEYNAESNKVATVATVTKAVADLEGAMHFRGRVTGDTLDAAITASGITDWAAGDVVLWGDYEYVFDGNAWLELGNTGLYQLKADAEDQHEALQKAIDDGLALKQNIVPFEYTPTDDDKAATVKSVTERITNINYGGGDFGTSKFATKVSQGSGQIEVEYAQPAVADIAGLEDEFAAVEKTIADGLALKEDKLPIDGTPSDENPVLTLTSFEKISYPDNGYVEGEFVTKVTQSAGQIEVSRAKINTDMIDAGTETWVFDCGNSAV